MIKRNVAVCLMILILTASLIPQRALATDPDMSVIGGGTSDWNGSTTTNVSPPSADSEMRSDSPDTNYGSASTFQAYYSSGGGTTRRGILKFDLTGIPTSAFVHRGVLYLYASDGSNLPLTVYVNRVQQSPARDWTEGGVTWNKYDGTNSWTTPGGDFIDTDDDQYVLVDTTPKWCSWVGSSPVIGITPAVQSFVKTSSTNYGWIVSPDTGFSGIQYVTFDLGTNRPYLTVTYMNNPLDIVGYSSPMPRRDGLMAGDDSDSLAFGIRIGGLVTSSMTAGDKWEINFTVGTVNFAMLFVATGSSAGKLRLFYYDSGSWVQAEAHDESGPITSGTRFQSADGDIAAKLTNTAPDSLGVVKLEVKKSRLTELGASGSEVTNIAGYTYSGSDTGYPDPGEGTKKDRAPLGTSYASYTMTGGAPEFPLGLLVLAAPVAATYLHFRRHRDRSIRVQTPPTLLRP